MAIYVSTLCKKKISLQTLELINYPMFYQNLLFYYTVKKLRQLLLPMVCFDV